MTFPTIDPVAFEFGPFVVRWYALAYVVGVVAGWQHALHLIRSGRISIPLKAIDDLFLWALAGIVLGGRLGYIIFYQGAYYLSEPLKVFAVWEGGMSFHGALIGVGIALAMVAHRNNIKMAALADSIAPMAPFGLMLGRFANFINGELYGRVSGAYWSFPFSRGGAVNRHPSQLYEAFLEGFLLLLIMLWFTYRRKSYRRHGCLTGIFLTGYGCARIFAEFFREPDAQIGLVWGIVTLGQLLSIPIIVLGVFFIQKSKMENSRG